MCASKNYPYLPHRRDFSLDPPPPSLWKFQSWFTHLLKFLGLWDPPLHPPGISNSFCWGTMDIFRNYTFPSALHLLVMIIKEENWFCPLLGLECWKKVISFQNGASWINVQSKRKSVWVVSPINTWMSLK